MSDERPKPAPTKAAAVVPAEETTTAAKKDDTPPSCLKRCRTSMQELTIPPERWYMGYWDTLTSLALVFTAFVTPFEIGFTDPAATWAVAKTNPLFIVNRCVDCLFIMDLLVSFLRQFRDSSGNIKRDVITIARYYLRGWFTVDFISVIPFDVITLEEVGLIKPSAGSRLKVLRLIRLLRLMKLIKILRASKTFEEWETSMRIDYSMLNLAFYVTMIMVFSHWIACTWALTGRMHEAEKYDDDGQSDVDWITQTEANKGRLYKMKTLYFAALHFAVMTLTTVGYGDIVPYSDAEYVVCVIIMLIGGMFWAYVIGGLCEIATSMDPHGTKYKQIMGDLNFMMDDHDMDNGLQCEIRRFWKASQHLQRLQSYGELVERLSPALKGKVAWAANKWWLAKVWYFNEMIYADEDGDGDPDPEYFAEMLGYKMPPAVGTACEVAMNFVSELARQVNFHMFAAGERMPGPPTALCVIVNRGGLVGRQGRMKRFGDVWGYDVLLVRGEEMQKIAAAGMVMMLTFVEIGRLERDDFQHVLQEGGDNGEGFPQMVMQMRRARAWMALKSMFVSMAQQKQKTGMFPWEIAEEKRKAEAALPKGPSFLDEEDGAAASGGDEQAHKAEVAELTKQAEALRKQLAEYRRRELEAARSAVANLEAERKAMGGPELSSPPRPSVIQRPASGTPNAPGAI